MFKKLLKPEQNRLLELKQSSQKEWKTYLLKEQGKGPREFSCIEQGIGAHLLLEPPENSFFSVSFLNTWIERKTINNFKQKASQPTSL